ncbi:unnamed protein product [Gordionus sp. m RMFG-2023]
MNTTKIKALRKWFARFETPRQIVSDNGPQFISGEFRKFCFEKNIKLIHTTPYHLKTNGLAERTIRTLTSRYFATRKDIREPKEAVGEVLIAYRMDEHQSTGRSPAKLLLGRNLKTGLNWLHPNVRDEMERSNIRQSSA